MVKPVMDESFDFVCVCGAVDECEDVVVVVVVVTGGGGV